MIHPKLIHHSRYELYNDCKNSTACYIGSTYNWEKEV